MKANGHIMLGGAIFGMVLALLFFYKEMMLLTDLKILTLTLGVILYFIGVILPDSDIEDRKSRVFYSYALVFGWIARLMEYPLSSLLKRKIGHHQSLHTITGVFFTSLVISFIVSFIPYMFEVFQLYTTPYLFFCLFLGQVVHLLGDMHFKLY